MGSRRDCTWILGLAGFRVVTTDGDGEAVDVTIAVEQKESAIGRPVDAGDGIGDRGLQLQIGDRAVDLGDRELLPRRDDSQKRATAPLPRRAFASRLRVGRCFNPRAPRGARHEFANYLAR